MLVGGHWNSPGFGVIYACRSFAGAMLECLAHTGIGRIPKTYVSVELRIPNSVATEMLTEETLPIGWDAVDVTTARTIGDAWIESRRSAIMVVPSVVACKERNALLNPLHRDFTRIVAGKIEPVIWDARLFKTRG